ncbi:MAG TPA: hypothetical protein VFE30_10210 [Anaeromyxobacteraceae bacterium]|jgi:hypothetical protein|nr:hypothetical protein [Anaeromyxobacteraceae bacterium]
MSLRSALRQLRQHPEFRIAEIAWPERIADVLRVLGERPDAEESVRQKSPERQAQMLADVSTGLWRLRQKMQKPGTNQPLDEMRRAYRHLESVWDALAQAGVEIHDYTDRPFDQGLSLKVIAYQPTPGLARQRIIETIKPSVYLGSEMIQMGEVVVGTPGESVSG